MAEAIANGAMTIPGIEVVIKDAHDGVKLAFLRT
jgi:hypothetical protein